MGLYSNREVERLMAKTGKDNSNFMLIKRMVNTVQSIDFTDFFM